MTSPIDVPPDEMKTVENILSRFTPRPNNVWVFGSRARLTARRFSDLDLAIDAGQRLSIVELARLQSEFEDSDLPWRVDVVDLNAVGEGFRGSILAHAVPIPIA